MAMAGAVAIPVAGGGAVAGFGVAFIAMGGGAANLPAHLSLLFCFAGPPEPPAGASTSGTDSPARLIVVLMDGKCVFLIKLAYLHIYTHANFFLSLELEQHSRQLFALLCSCCAGRCSDLPHLDAMASCL